MESIGDDDDRRTSKVSSEKVQQSDIISALRSIKIDNVEYSEPVKRRIKALKQLQLDVLNMEAKFYEEVHALECKYNTMCAPVYEKRSQIAAGVYEPTDEECVWDSDEEEDEQDAKTNVKIEEVTENKTESENVKGIPEFWLTIFKNVGITAEMVEEHDEPILKHLYDIKVIFLESNPMGFVLEFHFEPNEYFSNSVLTKEYIMKCAPEKSDPFSFEGPEIYKSKGCTIDWKRGKNVTVKTIQKNQKHIRGPPVVPDDADAELNDDTHRLLKSDFEIGHYIRERIIPRAVVYFTGEGLEDEDEDWDEEGDEDDDDDEDRDDDEDDDEEGSNANPRAIPGQAAECKQQ